MILRNTVLDSSYSQVSKTMLGFFGALRETHFSFKSGVDILKEKIEKNLFWGINNSKHSNWDLQSIILATYFPSISTKNN